VSTVRGLLERWAFDPASADRPFLLTDAGRWTWRQTWERSVLYANALLHLGGAEEAPLQSASVRPQDCLAIIFTSGSTGAPKAILNSHGKIIGAGTASTGPLVFGYHDVFYAAMPLFHSSSLGLALLRVGSDHGATARRSAGELRSTAS
jgi:acyl-CoA synthetase (AMP-forming)/AMP-acid ligase II